LGAEIDENLFWSFSCRRKGFFAKVSGRLKRSATQEAECKINRPDFLLFIYALFNLILPLSTPNLLTTVFILKIPKPEFT
ncbi:hypothetical protein, partial [Neisseria sp. P0014.S009]|uniref:hypothetical protein n=1 Tax=unclassified Neisseria TaxID=2623750 RepID=UPI003F7ED9A6